MKNILLIFASAVILLSCAEDEIKTYDAKDFIYFGNRTVGTNVYWDTLMTFNFFFEPSYEEKIINLKVSRGGIVPADMDKEFLIDVNVKSGVEGVDFDVDRVHVMPAGKSYVNVPVTIRRTPALEGKTFEIEVVLLPNENFTLDLPVIYQNRDTIQRTSMRVSYTNTLSEPELWNEDYLGYFSSAKFFEISKLFDLTIDDWTDDKRSFIHNIRHYSVAFMNYLNEQIAKGPEHAIKDPDAQSTRGYMSYPGYYIMGAFVQVPPVIVPAGFPTTAEWEGN